MTDEDEKAFRGHPAPFTPEEIAKDLEGKPRWTEVEVLPADSPKEGLISLGTINLRAIDKLKK